AGRARSQCCGCAGLARLSAPDHECLVTEAWGVCLPVPPPRLIADLVEGVPEDETTDENAPPPLPGAEIVESILRAESPFAGHPESVLTQALPQGVALVAVIGANGVRPPAPEETLAVGATIVFLAENDSM